MEEYKEFKNCKFHLGERVRVISKEEIIKLESNGRLGVYSYLYSICSQSGIVVDKLGSGYLLQMDNDELNIYHAKYDTRHMGSRKIFDNTVNEKFLIPYSKNKRLA